MNKSEFLAKHGFPGTPAGDRMKADLDELLDKWNRRRGTGGNGFLEADAGLPDVILEIIKGLTHLENWFANDPDRDFDLAELTITTKRIPSGAISVEVHGDPKEK